MSESSIVSSRKGRQRPKVSNEVAHDVEPAGQVVDARDRFEKKAAKAGKRSRGQRSKKQKQAAPEVIETGTGDSVGLLVEETPEIEFAEVAPEVAPPAKAVEVTGSDEVVHAESPHIAEASIEEAESAIASLKPGSRAIVTYRVDRIDHWSEATVLTVVSRFGASFSLPREIGLGRIVGICVPPERSLSGEQTSEAVTAPCLVQQCTKIVTDGKAAYNISVIFISNSLPRSFEMDPRQTYRVSGTDKHGLFRVEEAGTPFKQRLHPRFRIKFEVGLTLFRVADKSREKGEGITADVSASGISVVSSLEAQKGDKIKVACRDIDFYGMAIVKNRRTLIGHEVMLHLEFLEHTFPIQRIIAGPVESVLKPAGVLFAEEIVMGKTSERDFI